ncbi:MAG: hypothetical protein AAFR96_07235 [Planctomycetota bacterium]
MCVCALSGCQVRQVEGWYPKSLATAEAGYQRILEAPDYEPESEAVAAVRTLGRISAVKYQLDHLGGNVGRFKRSDADWDRLATDLAESYAKLAEVSAFPIDRLAVGVSEPEIERVLDDARLVIGRWGGAPRPERGSRRIRP